jgi:short-chain fatty acids transporter
MGGQRAGLGDLAARLTRLSSRLVPSSLSIALILTAVMFVLGMTLGRAGPLECVKAWGGGFWELLTFGMQMCLVVFSGYIVAVSKPVRAMLVRLVRLPRTPRGAVVMTAALSMSLAWVNWGLGLVTGAILVGIVSREHRDVDLRILVAVAYFGLGTTWHAGLSGSVPLLLATPDHFLVETAGVIPVGETIFSPFNLILAAAAFVLMLVVARAMYPREPWTADRLEEPIGEELEPPARPARPTPAERIEHSPVLNLVVGAAGLAWIVHHFATRGLALTLDVVNFTMLVAGIVLHWTPASLVAAARRASGLLHGIVLQFPLYAGMYGIMKDTALAGTLAHMFVSISSERTFPVVVCWYSSVLNYFVPSGGSKWAIEAPYVLDAARSMGVSVPRTAIAYAYGDMSTNLIQPFWAIPILAAARMEFRDVMGYLVVAFAAYMLLVSAAILLFL